MPKKDQQYCELSIEDLRLVLPLSKGMKVVEALRDSVEVLTTGEAIGHPELNLKVRSER